MNLFPPEISKSEIVPRPYQIEAHEALDLHMRTKPTNPCVVIPTGGGKSYQMAWDIQEWKREFEPLRVMVLAHRKELVGQNAKEFESLWPGGDIGIYHAGLRSRDIDRSITFAGIDSVYDKWGEFRPLDVIVVDEAHRIPAKGEGKYRTFINGCRTINENVRIVGYTATPYRMGCGAICHRDHILNEICYEANIGDLIAQGYLSRLRSKIGDVQPDLSNVRKNSGGDYIVDSLAEAVDRSDVVAQAVSSFMQIANRENRRSIIIFCVDIDHCHHVANELRKYGVEAPCVTSKTPQQERDRIESAVKSGHYRAVCNVNVYTEGFNAKCIDMVVLLRPTESVGLYVQMVGRGSRLFPGKEYCIVADYARCIETHGPVDCVGTGEVKLETCRVCRDTFSRAVRVCPFCGWEIPKEEIERKEAEEAKEKQMHEAKASNFSILGSEPEDVQIDAVSIHLHRKPGSPDSIRVQYRSGLSTFREWICLDHDGFAGKKARRWWAARFGSKEASEITVSDAIQDMFLGDRILGVTEIIRVIRKGKYTEIVAHKIKVQGVSKWLSA